MSVTQHEIEKLKEDFKNTTENKAEEKPVDFSAYLHLIQVKKIESLCTRLKLSAIPHKPSWAEVKNHLDDQEDFKLINEQ
jgi:hypothetical protein